MKILFDFFPIILFFITFKYYDDPIEGVLAATAVAIVATIIQVALFWLKNKRVEKMHLITLALISVLGGATLIFQDPVFIKWKPTAVNWLFAVAFLGSQYIGHKPILRRMMDGNISLPEPIWLRLNLAWVVFFVLMGIINLYVAFTFDLDTWVNFKLYGMLGMTFLFIILQAFYLARHMEKKETVEQEGE